MTRASICGIDIIPYIAKKTLDSFRIYEKVIIQPCLIKQLDHSKGDASPTHPFAMRYALSLVFKSSRLNQLQESTATSGVGSPHTDLVYFLCSCRIQAKSDMHRQRPNSRQLPLRTSFQSSKRNHMLSCGWELIHLCLPKMLRRKGAFLTWFKTTKPSCQRRLVRNMARSYRSCSKSFLSERR